MRILLIGAEGPVGRAAASALAAHEIVTAGRKSGDLRVDISDSASIEALYQQAGQLDAVICCAGSARFAPISEMTEEAFAAGLANKLMGQVNLVLKGLAHVAEGGSFTLTSGSLDRYPIRKGSNAATINAALSGFVRGAALDMPRGIRINVVSPTLLEESAEKLRPMIPGHVPVSAHRVGLAYVKAVEGAVNGETILVG
ncbi:short chain dehydrogenase [Aestuariivirga sp.]|uniref:short chain dehydrogenase n=1 Tax=Aestuariivirga sp. TaxID=2650926 RepID=UPI0039E2E946